MEEACTLDEASGVVDRTRIETVKMRLGQEVRRLLGLS